MWCELSHNPQQTKAYILLWKNPHKRPLRYLQTAFAFKIFEKILKDNCKCSPELFATTRIGLHKGEIMVLGYHIR